MHHTSTLTSADEEGGHAMHHTSTLTPASYPSSMTCSGSPKGEVPGVVFCIPAPKKYSNLPHTTPVCQTPSICTHVVGGRA